MKLKAGAWLTFKCDKVTPQQHEQLHHARDGSLVGIYLPAGMDALDNYGPDRIMLCQPDGTNLVVMDQTKDPPFFNLFVLFEDATNIKRLDDPKDIPKGRIVREGWKPPAQAMREMRAMRR